MEYVNAHYRTAPVTEGLEITPVDSSFLGSRNRKLFGLFETDDRLYTGTLAEPVPFTRTDNAWGPASGAEQALSTALFSG